MKLKSSKYVRTPNPSQKRDVLKEKKSVTQCGEIKNSSNTGMTTEMTVNFLKQLKVLLNHLTVLLVALLTLNPKRRFIRPYLIFTVQEACLVELVLLTLITMATPHRKV